MTTGPGMETLRDARSKLEPGAALVPEVIPTGPGSDVLHSRLALTDPEVLKGQLAAYSAARKLFVDWLFSNLTAGVDYMLIHRKIGRGQARQDCSQKQNRTGRGCEKCGGKATLCKPGSEKICGLLRLRPRFRKDDETWTMLGADSGTLAFVCELVNETSGSVVAEGRGCRTKAQDYDDINKTVKMVQKSAQTDAVLRCAGLSEVFTQDLEDMPGGANGGDRSDLTPPPPISDMPDDPAPDAEVAGHEEDAPRRRSFSTARPTRCWRWGGGS